MRRGHGYVKRLGPMALVCVMLAGCAGGASGPPTVGLSIVAPTDGSTVGVRTLELVGNVTPANAVVMVGRTAVRVHGGTFRQPLVLLSRLTHLAVSATANGFRGSSTVVSVRYSPKLFAHPAAAPRPRRQATGLQSPAPVGSQTPVGSPASVAQSEQAALGTPSAAEFAAGCDHGNAALASYCTCVWQRIKSAGYDNLDKLRAVVMNWRRTFLSRGVIVYPPAMKSAVLGCVSRIGLP